MKITGSLVVTGMLCIACAVVDLVPGIPVQSGFLANANAVIGRPLTPMSYAGVARRSVYGDAGYIPEAVIADTAVVAGAEIDSDNAQGDDQADGSSAAAVGNVVTDLPDDCDLTEVNNVEYSLCDGVYYRASFQGNVLVYRVVPAPV